MNYISHLKPHIFTRLIQTKLTLQTNQVLLLKPNSSPISFLYIRTEIYNLSDNVHHGPPAVPDHSPDRPDTESQPRPVQLPVIERAINRTCGSSRLSIATSPQPAPASEVRRSARASKAPDTRWSRGMGNITTQQITQSVSCQTSIAPYLQYQSSVWRPWKWWDIPNYYYWNKSDLRHTLLKFGPTSILRIIF